MKKKIFAISLIAFGLMSCEGESIDSMNTSNENNDLKSRFLNIGQETGLRELYNTSGCYYCDEPRTGNCLDTIVIEFSVNDKKVFDFMVEKIVAGDKEEIKNYFYDNEKEISRLLDNNLVKGVISGELFVTHNNGRDSSFVLIFKDKKDNIIAAQPFMN